ncbi:uncharacterized protein N7496_005652 [Penicillium cataractarum]|uniref:Xylanolytic transcriptional activator regulatory domain-containing protein n=1 Tax=Penicillium cataractarum TaxID=2100454 RepID=A0A9W9SGM8_9EURO|nr:uncharacterized protein N7496_005652 [Penicillium cataractarum]KAJ5378243.1 hypothetical protein N7496_005652 [Penicillium cataractarum]
MLERQLVGQLDGLDGPTTKVQRTPESTPPFEEIITGGRDGGTTLLEYDSGNIGPLFAGSDGKSPDLTDLSDFQDFPDLSPHLSSMDLTNVDSMPAAYTDWHAAGGIIMSNLGTTTPVKQYEPIPTLVSDNLRIPALVREDLDQLFFERVHPISPIVHKQQYFEWALDQNYCPTPAQACLQRAMHTAAAAASSQFREIEDTLYTETRGMLGALDIRPMSSGRKYRPRSTSTDMPLEQIQSWLLVAQYEFLRKDEHQAMITAGRAFRLVQLARLFDIDSACSSSAAMEFAIEGVEGINYGHNPIQLHLRNELFSRTEEKRRVFWMAYCLDRFLNWRNEWPLTLDEDTIRTRLPAPEANFQSNQPIETDFLPEVLDGNGRAPVATPFAECILLATLCGRCMSHRRMASAVTLSKGGSETREFWSRHDALAAAVEKRRQSIAQSFHGSNRSGKWNSPSVPAPTSNLDLDPLLTFTYVLAQGAIIYLSTTTENANWQSAEHQVRASTYQQRAFRAAVELIRLARVIPRIGRFKVRLRVIKAPVNCLETCSSIPKVHPFVPSALSQAVEFLTSHANSPHMASMDGEEAGCGLGALFNALDNLKDINNLARELLDELQQEGLGPGHKRTNCTY